VGDAIDLELVNADRVKRFRDSNSRASRSSCWRTTPANRNALWSGEMAPLRRHVEALAACLLLRRPKIRRHISTLICTDAPIYPCWWPCAPHVRANSRRATLTLAMAGRKG